MRRLEQKLQAGSHSSHYPEGDRRRADRLNSSHYAGPNSSHYAVSNSSHYAGPIGANLRAQSAGQQRPRPLHPVIPGAPQAVSTMPAAHQAYFGMPAPQQAYMSLPSALPWHGSDAIQNDAIEARALEQQREIAELEMAELEIAELRERLDKEAAALRMMTMERDMVTRERDALKEQLSAKASILDAVVLERDDARKCLESERVAASLAKETADAAIQQIATMRQKLQEAEQLNATIGKLQQTQQTSHPPPPPPPPPPPQQQQPQQSAGWEKGISAATQETAEAPTKAAPDVNGPAAFRACITSTEEIAKWSHPPAPDSSGEGSGAEFADTTIIFAPGMEQTARDLKTQLGVKYALCTRGLDFDKDRPHQPHSAACLGECDDNVVAWDLCARRLCQRVSPLPALIASARTRHHAPTRQAHRARHNAPGTTRQAHRARHNGPGTTPGAARPHAPPPSLSLLSPTQLPQPPRPPLPSRPRSFPNQDPDIKVRIDAVRDRHIIFLLNLEHSELLFDQLALVYYLQGFHVPKPSQEAAKCALAASCAALCSWCRTACRACLVRCCLARCCPATRCCRAVHFALSLHFVVLWRCTHIPPRGRVPTHLPSHPPSHPILPPSHSTPPPSHSTPPPSHSTPSPAHPILPPSHLPSPTWPSQSQVEGPEDGCQMGRRRVRL